MKQLLFIFYFLTISVLGFADSALINPTVPDLPPPLHPRILQKENGISELSKLDHLIEITTKNLETQKRLRDYLMDYKQLEKNYLKNPQDKTLLFRFVKTARQLLNTIKENHLEHIFSSEFMNELNLLSQITNKKRGI